VFAHKETVYWDQEGCSSAKSSGKQDEGWNELERLFLIYNLEAEAIS
jgi:hypothetical protein